MGGGILTHICCLPQVYPAPSSWIPDLSACTAVGGWSSSQRACGAVRPPLVLLMCLTIAPHPHHLGLLCLRYGYRPLGRKWERGGAIYYERVDMNKQKMLHKATLQSGSWCDTHSNMVAHMGGNLTLQTDNTLYNIHLGTPLHGIRY